MPLFQTSQASQLHLAVDMGTTLISGLVWRESSLTRREPRLTRRENGREAKPDILEVIRMPLAGEGAHHHLVSALKIFLARAETALGGRDPASLTIGLAAPYYQGRTVWSHQRFERPTAVSTAVIDHVCTQAEEEHAHLLSAEEELFGRDMLCVYANGYAINALPQQALAHEVSVATRFSSLRSVLRTHILGLFEERYPHAHFQITTFPAAFGRLLQHLPHGAGHAAVIDIGGTVSECSFFEEGTLTDVITVPHGVATWISSVAREKRIAPGELLHVLNHPRFKQDFQEHMGQWRRLMRPIIAARVLRQPDYHLFLVGGGALLDQSRAALSSLLHTIPLGSRADIHTLSADIFRDQFRTWPSSIISALDVGLLTLLF